MTGLLLLSGPVHVLLLSWFKDTGPRMRVGYKLLRGGTAQHAENGPQDHRGRDQPLRGPGPYIGHFHPRRPP